MSVRAIVLAAGKGTRMKSRIPKVLHEVCGRPMLWYTLRELRAAGIDDILVVTNDELQARIGEFGVPGVVQREQLGTGHAVKIALEASSPRPDSQVVIAYGDMPLVPQRSSRGSSRRSMASAAGRDVARYGEDAATVELRTDRPPRRRRGRAHRRGARRRRQTSSRSTR